MYINNKNSLALNINPDAKDLDPNVANPKNDVITKVVLDTNSNNQFLSDEMYKIIGLALTGASIFITLYVYNSKNRNNI
jgi:hypothetical protein